MSFSKCSGDVFIWRGLGKCHIELAMGKADGGGYIALHLSVCLIEWHGKAILIGNRMLHILKGTVGSAVHNWILRVRIACLEPFTSVAMQCSCQSLTMCCHHRRKKGSQHIWCIPMASARDSTIGFEN